MFKDFFAFLLILDLTWPQVSTLLLLAVMEYLHNSGMSTANITNYMTAIRCMYIIYGMDTACMRDQRIPMFVRALTRTRVFNPSLPITIDENILSHII